MKCWCHFFRSLDGYEVHNRAGSGLFFMLMIFSNFDFQKICFGGKDPSEYGILKMFPSGGYLLRELPKFALHRKNGDSAGNYHLKNMELLGEWLFCRELQAHGRGIHR
jgi:hypothetical protein